MNRSIQPMPTGLRLALPLCAGLLFLLAAAVGASEVRTGIGPDGSTVEALDDLDVFGGGEGNAAKISLEDAIEMALERNLSLDVERYRRSQTAEAIREAWGIYDLNFTSTLGASENSTPISSLLQAASVDTSEFLQWNNQLTQLTPFGGTVTVDYNNTRAEFSDLNRQPNPRYIVDLDFTFDQPLLRGFGRVVTEQNLLIARNTSAISREDFQVQVESVVQQVIDAYWQLVEAREQLEVAQDSLELAKELHEMNRIQVDVGTKAPLEMVQSEAGVATREEDIIRFQAQVEDNADLLRQLLNFGGGELWFVELEPTTDPEVEHQEIDLRQAVRRALEKRPDIRRQQLSNKTLEIRSEVAQNQKKPRLDFGITWGVNGLDGDFDATIGDIRIVGEADYFDTLEQALDADFDGWNLGFTFAYPLQNRAAESRSVQADLALEEGRAQLRNLEQQVYTSVRRTARAVETAAKQIDSARVSSKLALKNLEAEQKRYENGLSTSFQVLEIQEDLSNARRREVSAIIAYRRAQAAFHKEVGELLSEHQIELVDEATSTYVESSMDGEEASE